ncbi:MAG: hypothetical protein ACOYNI_07190 [Acidimicrobiia bacterium]
MNRKASERAKNVGTGLFVVGALTTTGYLLKSTFEERDRPATAGRTYSDETVELLREARDTRPGSWPYTVADELLRAEIQQQSNDLPPGLTVDDLDARINGLTAELESHVMTNERVRAALSGPDGTVNELTRLGAVQAAAAAGVSPEILLFSGVAPKQYLQAGPRADQFNAGLSNLALGMHRAPFTWSDIARGVGKGATRERNPGRSLGG